MPIEIKELIIRATIEDVAGEKARSGDKKEGDVSRVRLIEECVEQVLEVLRRKKER